MSENKSKINNKNKRGLQFKVVPIALSVNAILIILFVSSGGYNHYDIAAANSKYHTHLMNSKMRHFFLLLM